MHEEVSYVSGDYPEWLFHTYTGSRQKKAIENLQKTIRILKFYSTNDFAFKDVHNEEQFYQNGNILIEVVQLFQQYRVFSKEEAKIWTSVQDEKSKNKVIYDKISEFFQKKMIL